MAEYVINGNTVYLDQWFKNGDHPDDGKEVFETGRLKGQLIEGKVVRYYRHPFLDAGTSCLDCGKSIHDHGFIDEHIGFRVCPGDYVITMEDGSHYPIKPWLYNKVFKKVN